MNTMLATAQAAIRKAGKDLGYDSQTIEQFLAAEKEHAFTVNAGGKQYPAYRVQHSSRLGPHKGGIRFHPNVNLDEVRALATLMSLKTAANGLPLGGGKGGVVVDPRALTTAELEELSRDYARQLAPHIGSDKDVPAPDVNTDGQIMNWMVDEFEKVTGHKDRGSFTGKSLGAGGSEGRVVATGYGAAVVLAEYLAAKGLDKQPMTVAVQGFGNAGLFFVQALQKCCPSLKLVAVSNSRHTWYQPEGFEQKEIPAGAGRAKPEDALNMQDAQVMTPEAVMSLPADILVLAALEDAVTAQNAGSLKAKLLVEVANGPITAEAEARLLASGTVILPDVVVNAGGVVVSCLEWQQNLQDEHWTEAKVLREMEQTLQRATKAMMTRAGQRHTSYKQAAFEIALERLLGEKAKPGKDQKN